MSLNGEKSQIIFNYNKVPPLIKLPSELSAQPLLAVVVIAKPVLGWFGK